MHSLVYVLAALPMFASIGLMCYCLLVDRFKWTALVVMILCIVASFSYMENYYDHHEKITTSQTNISCVQKDNHTFICQR